jgi:hypothetical protein
MTLKNRKEALEEAVNRLLEEESAVDSTDPYRYAKTVFWAFDEIRFLLEKGVKFVRICKAFEISGMLPENSSAHSFRQAFHRERKRRVKNGFADKKMDAEKTASVFKASPKAEPVKPNFGTPRTSLTEKEKEKERVKALAGSAEETALGKITKHSDGSFDFDWKN